MSQVLFGGGAPTVPDGSAVAYAQGAATVNTAMATNFLSNIDEDTPSATVTYVAGDTYSLVQPQINATTGEVTGTITQTLTRRKKTVAFKAAQQALYDKQLETQKGMQDVASTLMTRVQSSASTPIDITGLPSRGATPQLPGQVGTLPVPGDLVERIGSFDTLAHRQRIADFLDVRLDAKRERERERRRVQLHNSLQYPGSEAYRLSMLEFDDAATDAKIQAYLASGTDLAQTVMLEQTVAQFANQVQDTKFQQSVLRIDFSNRVELTRFQALAQIAQYLNAQREDSLKEQLIVRNQSISEISSLVHGTQMQMPQFQGYQASPIQAPPLADSIWSAYGARNQQFNQQVQSQQSLFGGLMGLGANLLGMPGGMGGMGG